MRPRVLVEVKFNEWTAEGKLRQPIFVGIRDDKKPTDVKREPVGPAAKKSRGGQRATTKSPRRKRAAAR